MVQASYNKIIAPPEREIGDYWSQQFADMMNVWFGVHKFDKAPSPLITLPNMQKVILADVWLLEKQNENYYCEVKHKAPTRFNCYGLEEYRLQSLLTLQNYVKGIVLYVIHDHSLNGGVHNKENNIDHWKCIEANELDKTYENRSWGKSLVNGELKRVPICYWNCNMWILLKEYFLKWE